MTNFNKRISDLLKRIVELAKADSTLLKSNNWTEEELKHLKHHGLTPYPASAHVGASAHRRSVAGHYSDAGPGKFSVYKKLDSPGYHTSASVTRHGYGTSQIHSKDHNDWASALKSIENHSSARSLSSNEKVSKAESLSMGKTQSGKDIPYDTEHPSFETFNAQDHADAARAFAVHAKNAADQYLSGSDHNKRIEANKFLARASFHRDKEKHHHWLAEHAAKEKIKATPKPYGFVHVNQHHSAIINRNPNPVQGQPKNLDDLTKLAQYHGKPMHEFSDTPDKKFGHATYQIGPDESLKFVHANYDTSG